MCLLPVFFMVSDLGGRTGGGQPSFWEQRWGRFSQFENFPECRCAEKCSHVCVYFVFCCLTCRLFPKKRYFVAGVQVCLLPPSLHSVHVSTDLLEGHLQRNTHRHTKVSHGSSVNCGSAGCEGDSVVIGRLTGSRWESSHRLPLLSLDEATLM